MKCTQFLMRCAVLLAHLHCCQCQDVPQADNLAPGWNVSLVHTSTVRSRLSGVTGWRVVCDLRDLQEHSSNCYGGAHRWMGYTNQLLHSTANDSRHITIKVDLGDSMMGTLFFSEGDSGRLDAQIMALQKMDVILLSNMDLQAGVDNVLAWMRLLDEDTDVIASNADWSSTMLKGSRLKRWSVRVHQGMKVGFVGYIDAEVSKLFMRIPENFIVNPKGMGPAMELSDAVAELQWAHNDCKLIVLLGGNHEQVDLTFETLLKTTVGVSAGLKRDPLTFMTPTFEFAQYDTQGFSHPFYVESAQGRVRPYSQTTTYGSGMGHLWLSTDLEGALEDYGGKHVLLDSNVPEDEQALKVLEDMKAALGLVGMEHVGNISADVDGSGGSELDESTWPGCWRHECQMGQLVTRSMLHYCNSSAGCDFALVNGGSIRESFRYSNSTRGSVTMAMIQTVLPFQNYIVTFDITGERIKQALQDILFNNTKFIGSFPQVSGLRFVFNPLAETRSMVIVMLQVMKEGRWMQMHDQEYYRMATNDYIFAGGDRYTLPQYAHNVFEYGLELTVAMKNYFKSFQPDPVKVSTREELSSCVGLNAHTVVGKWPSTAEHCSILAAEATVMDICKPGHYSNFNGTHHTCMMCPLGTASMFGDNTWGDEACEECPPGYFSAKLGALECVPCNDIGTTYQSLRGQSKCLACPDGTTRVPGSLGVNISECVCKENFYSPEGLPHGVKCVPCMQGGRCEGHLKVIEDFVSVVNSAPYPVTDFWGDPDHPFGFLECLKGRCRGGKEFLCERKMHRSMPSNRMCQKVGRGFSDVAGQFVYECPGGYQSTASIFATILSVVAVVSTFLWIRRVLFAYEAIDIFFKNLRIMAMISSFQLRWSPCFTPLFVIFKFALFSVDIAQPNCMMEWGFQYSFVAQLLLPICLSFTSWMPMIPQVLNYKSELSYRQMFLDKEAPCASSFNHAIAGMLKAFSMCYASVVNISFAVFSCQQYPDGNRYLTVDPSVQCWQGTHIAMLGVACVVLPLVLGLPLAIPVWLNRSSAEGLHDQAMLQRFGALYKNKLVKYQWWEATYFLKLAILAMIQVTLQDKPLWQLLLTMIIIIAHLVAHVSCKPLIKRSMVWLESIMMVVSCIFLVTGAMFYSHEFQERGLLAVVFFTILLFALGWTVAVSWNVLRDEVASKTVSKALVKKVGVSLRTLVQEGTQPEFMSERLAKLVLEKRSMDAEELSPTSIKAKARSLRRINSVLKTVSRHALGSSSRDPLRNLKLEELHMTIRGGPFRTWAQACNEVSDLDLVFAADEWIAPIVAASSRTSVFANTDEARFWRSVLLAFPAALSWICTEATPEEATLVKECFNTLAKTSLSKASQSEPRYAKIISVEDRSSVLCFMCATPATHAYYGLLQTHVSLQDQQMNMAKLLEKICSESTKSKNLSSQMSQFFFSSDMLSAWRPSWLFTPLGTVSPSP